jgi:hypothetical protein
MPAHAVRHPARKSDTRCGCERARTGGMAVVNVFSCTMLSSMDANMVGVTRSLNTWY